jgi:hypothetical protein
MVMPEIHLAIVRNLWDGDAVMRSEFRITLYGKWMDFTYTVTIISLFISFFGRDTRLTGFAVRRGIQFHDTIRRINISDNI